MACNNPAIVRIGITPSTFKEYFPRNFSYLPVWSNTATYLQGQVVYYATTANFYLSLVNGNTNLPTNTTYWQIYNNTLSYVYDDDIERAFGEACMKFNSSLFYDDEEIKIGFLYLSAHFLRKDLDAVGSAAYFGNVNSRTVGNVSESYTIPDWLVKSPTFSFLGSTWYGVKYANMIWNRTRGNMKAVWSGTNPA